MACEEGTMMDLDPDHGTGKLHCRNCKSSMDEEGPKPNYLHYNLYIPLGHVRVRKWDYGSGLAHCINRIQEANYQTLGRE